jgi:hypothetical protein
MTGRALRRGVAAVLTGVLLLASGGCSHPTDSTTPPSRGEVRAMLEAHAAAVLAHHRAGFVAGLAGSAAARRFRSAQLQQYANLAQLPLTHWQYVLGERARAPGAQAVARRRFGPSAVIYQVTLRFALRGVDSQPTSHQLYWTFERGTAAGSVVAADDSALASVGGASWRAPWDFGALTVVAGQHSLVLGHPGAGRSPLVSLASTVDAAVPRVSAVWGDDWSRDVLVLVPASAAELQADLGSAAGDAAPVVAIATSDGTDPVTGAPLGQRLVVDPARLRRLSAVGERIVLQHEVTHIATAAATTDATPTWLVEGFAEYVGNLGSGQSVTDTAHELTAAVRSGAVPHHLPASSAFAGSRAAQAYQEAWLACRLVAARAGSAGLVRLYRMVGRDGSTTPDLAVAHALRRVLGEPMARFVGQWRNYLRRQLGRSG